jgi:hypothetical protein
MDDSDSDDGKKKQKPIATTDQLKKRFNIDKLEKKFEDSIRNVGPKMEQMKQD